MTVGRLDTQAYIEVNGRSWWIFCRVVVALLLRRLLLIAVVVVPPSLAVLLQSEELTVALLLTLDRADLHVWFEISVVSTNDPQGHVAKAGVERLPALVNLQHGFLLRPTLEDPDNPELLVLEVPPLCAVRPSLPREGLKWFCHRLGVLQWVTLSACDQCSSLEVGSLGRI